MGQDRVSGAFDGSTPWLYGKGMQPVRGAPDRPQPQGTIECSYQTFKNRILPRTSVPEAPHTSHIIWRRTRFHRFGSGRDGIL